MKKILEPDELLELLFQKNQQEYEQWWQALEDDEAYQEEVSSD